MQIIRDNVSNAATEFVEVVKPTVKKYNKISKKHDAYTDIISKVNDLFTSLSKMVYFPQTFHTVSASLGVFSATDLLFAPLRLGKSVKDIICSETALKRVRAVAESIKEVSIVGLDISGIYFMLRAFDVIASSTLSWIGVVAPIFAAVRSITLPFSGYDLYKLNQMRKAIQKHCKRADESLGMNKRVERAARGLRFIKRNSASIEKTAGISKKAALKKRAGQLLMQMNPESREKALEDAERLMSQLRTHVRTKTVHDALAFGADVTGIALTALAVSVSPVFQPALSVSAVVMAAAYLGLLGGKYLMLTKNPFDQKPEGFVGRMVRQTREGVQDVSHCAYKAMKYVTVRPVQRVALGVALALK